MLSVNSDLIKDINLQRGLVTQTTYDFQSSCNAILKRQRMLKSVSAEIKSHLRYYTDFDTL